MQDNGEDRPSNSRQAPAVQDDERRLHIEEEMGDLLFAIANLSRKLGVEPEAALRRADDKFQRRFTAMEARFAARGESMKDADLVRMEEEWTRVKQQG